MTSNVQTSSPVRPATTDTAFPGRTIGGWCLIVAPLLAVIGSAVGTPAYHAKGADFVDGMVHHASSFQIGVQTAEAAIVLMIFAVVAIAGLASASQPRLSRLAGFLVVIGLCGPISFESTYWAGSRIVDSSAHRAVAAVMIDEAQIIPRTIMNVTGPCLVIGFILLAVAARRAGLLDLPRAVLLGLTAAIPFGFISGFLAVSAVAFCCTALAMVPLGVRMLRA